jgi:hypothetical protein
VPQIAYYFWAYARLAADGRIAFGRPVNVCVPTGNFGNILAAWYAREMGLPIARLICASNRNNVLSDFIRTGVYDRNRPFYQTTSPSMDILISSNLERLLFELTGRDAGAVAAMMEDLAKTGRYALPAEARAKLDAFMSGGWADEAQVAGEIARTFREGGYLCDPHTAVALSVHARYSRETGDRTPVIIASTASPYKFGKAVARALFGEEAASLDDFACCDRLAQASGGRVPRAIAQLREKPILHTAVCDQDGMQDALMAALPAGFLTGRGFSRPCRQTPDRQNQSSANAPRPWSMTVKKKMILIAVTAAVLLLAALWMSRWIGRMLIGSVDTLQAAGEAPLPTEEIWIAPTLAPEADFAAQEAEALESMPDPVPSPTDEAEGTAPVLESRRIWPERRIRAPSSTSVPTATDRPRARLAPVK